MASMIGHHVALRVLVDYFESGTGPVRETLRATPITDGGVPLHQLETDVGPASFPLGWGLAMPNSNEEMMVVNQGPISFPAAPSSMTAATVAGIAIWTADHIGTLHPESVIVYVELDAPVELTPGDILRFEANDFRVILEKYPGTGL